MSSGMRSVIIAVPLTGEEGEPEGVDEGVEDGGGSEGAGFHPGAAVEKSGDGGEKDVAPVGDRRVEDVGEAEDEGGDEPSGVAAVERARQQILQQSAKQKFLWPGGEDEN